ncbi:MAG: MarR family winged helix-turn-helix transcriptional regulator [Dehalococcoidia bacterium]
MSSTHLPDRQTLLTALREDLVRLSNHNGFYTEAVAARLGLNRTDVDCLSILALEGVITPGRLAEATGLSSGGVSGILDRLERTGFIRRESDPADRRRVLVWVSPEQGRRLIEVFTPMQEALDALYESFSDDELAVLLRLSQQSLAIMQEGTANLRTKRAESAVVSESDGVFSAPLAGEERGVLELIGGAHTIHLRAEADMGELFRARFASGGMSLRVSQGTVTVRGRWRPFGGRPEGEIAITAALPWALRLRGGSSHVVADLRDVAVTEIDMYGGMNALELQVGVPSGTVPIRVSGGASQLSLRRPPSVPVRLHVRGGVNNLQFESEHSRSAYRGTWQTPGYDDADGRYEITVRGGLGRLHVSPL